jgi:hypothetical protein
MMDVGLAPENVRNEDWPVVSDAVTGAPLDPRLSVEARVELCAALVIDRAFVHWKMTQALVVEGQSRGRKSATGGSQS